MGKEDSRNDIAFTVLNPSGLKREVTPIPLAPRIPDLIDQDEMVQVFPKGHVKIVVVGGETNPYTQVWQFSRPSSVMVDKWK
jgi:hypothetical protein